MVSDTTGVSLRDRVGLRFAETMLYWRGILLTRELQDFLGVSEGTARGLVRGLRQRDMLAPHRPGHARGLLPISGFDPGSSVTDPNIALSQLLTADLLPGNPFVLSPMAAGGHDLPMTASVATAAMREIVAAGLARCPVWLLYAAKAGRQEFVFHPAAIVRSRGRYHMRGYRSDGYGEARRRLSERYVDMVPARAVEAHMVDGGHFVDLADDAAWSEFERHRFFLSPRLSNDERLCYEHEYGIADRGYLVVTCRRALFPYVRQELAERRCWRRDGTYVAIWDTREHEVGAGG